MIFNCWITEPLFSRGLVSIIIIKITIDSNVITIIVIVNHALCFFTFLSLLF
jgi:hypothetical protein